MPYDFKVCVCLCIYNHTVIKYYYLNVRDERKKKDEYINDMLIPSEVQTLAQYAIHGWIFRSFSVEKECENGVAPGSSGRKILNSKDCISQWTAPYFCGKRCFILSQTSSVNIKVTL